MTNHVPTHDDSGINLADPHDRRGLKSEYITLIQSLALRQYAGHRTGTALDLGCGFGRMSLEISRLGHQVVGTDPSTRVLRHASAQNPDIPFVTGRLPDLPFRPGAFETVYLLNVARPLLLLGILDTASVIGKYLAPGGRLIIIENARREDHRYVSCQQFESVLGRGGLKLTKRIAFRRARWPMIYLIRYGLVPRRFFRRIAEFEMRSLKGQKRAPRYSYHNVLYIFDRN